MNSTLTRTLISSALTTVLLVYSYLAPGAEVSRHDQTASGLSGWLVEDESIQIELNPLSRDQVRAFYMGRGFSEALSESIANSCVFQIVIENISESNPAIGFEIDLSDWRVLDSTGLDQALVSKEEWVERWTREGASRASLLAFKWATFPSQQFYKLKGDYGWGMILFAMPAGEPFDVRTVWRIGGDKVEQRVQGLTCID